MTRQMTYLMKTMEEQKLETDRYSAKVNEQMKEITDLKIMVQQQKEVIRQHETTIRDFHQQSVQTTNEAVNKWSSLQSKYEEVIILLIGR